jgi:23S rRNA pseudouridine2605 synthase
MVVTMTHQNNDQERIAKFIAHAGVCSRREAETLIEQGRVMVNGEIIKTPAIKVSMNDDIRVDGERLQRQAARVWRYHKPTGLLCSHKDPQARKTIYDVLQQKYPELPRVNSVGRLDLNSEGLLLLTNDGEVSRHMELPSTGWVRRYKVRVHGRVQEKDLEKLVNGITIAGVQYNSIQATLEKQQGANAWITIRLKEGKNREIRKVMEWLGYKVNRLIRLSYGPFQLGNLKENEVEEVSLKVLKDQIGQDFF